MSTPESDVHPTEGHESLLPVTDFDRMIALLKAAAAAAIADNRWHLAGKIADVLCVLLADEDERRWKESVAEGVIAAARANMPRMHPLPPAERLNVTPLIARTAGDTPEGEMPYGDTPADDGAHVACANTSLHRGHRWMQMPGHWRVCDGVRPLDRFSGFVTEVADATESAGWECHKCGLPLGQHPLGMACR